MHDPADDADDEMLDVLTARADLDTATVLGDRLAKGDGLANTVGFAMTQLATALRTPFELTYFTTGATERQWLDTLPIEDHYVLVRLARRLRNVASQTMFHDEVPDLGSVVPALNELIGDTVAIFRSLVNRHRSQPALEKEIEARLVALLSLQSNFRLAARAEGAVKKAVEAASAAAESAGDRAEQSLSEEFDKLAAGEARVANWFRGATIFLFVAVIVYAGAMTLTAETPSVELGQKLAIGIPVLLLAGYFGRESGQHRKTARWASVLGAQLRSVRAYTVSMGDDAAEGLRIDLGKRAFLETPDSLPPTSDGTPGSASDQSTARELLDLVKSNRQA